MLSSAPHWAREKIVGCAAALLARADWRVDAALAGPHHRALLRVVVVVRRRAAVRALLDLARPRRARVDQRQRQVVGQRGAVGDGLDLHVVDLADERRLGAGAGVGRLLAVGVGAVLVVVLQVLPGAPLVAGAGAHLQGDLVLLEVLTVLPGHADRGEAGDRLRRAGDPRVRGAARDRTTAQSGEAAAGAGERHLGHGRRDRRGRDRRRHQLGGRRLAAARGLPARVLADDVERDHTGGRREDDEHDTQGQHLLAEGDETGLKRSHERSTPVWGKVTQGRSFTPVTSVTEGFLSNYRRVISTRHAVTCM